VTPRYTDLQLDALRELANIASGTAATALSQMLGREVEINVPRAQALPMADAVDACGPADALVDGVVIPLEGDVAGAVVLLIPVHDSDRLCELLSVEPYSEVGRSAICEIGNIVGTSYLNGLAGTCGLRLEPSPPGLVRDMLGAIVASLLAQTAGSSEAALVLDSELDVADEPCELSFMLLPTAGGARDLLAPLGVEDAR
jgi:chemotaxis protein CheC